MNRSVLTELSTTSEQDTVSFTAPHSDAKSLDRNFPPSTPTNRTLVILVMTCGPDLEQRMAIRETWASGKSNVYFVIKQSPTPPGAASTENLKTDWRRDENLRSKLEMEQEQFQDLLITGELTLKDA
jgi:hypothetical protein